MAYIKTFGNMTYLHFFNIKEVYSVKGFDTRRKALNYAKKFGYDVYTNLPDGVMDFEYVN